ncbi:necrosis inducing protein-domain-containing protein [Podospora australis]|uniref:Necrosis inducing protein-domain-containing protein n=1 Tax=Podospora australis TaxID=1536484 RepID=A0AAN6WU30_9PEZI|nr:necrosis inducing protein-domain-containing protein [Podospora australis]
MPSFRTTILLAGAALTSVQASALPADPSDNLTGTNHMMSRDIRGTLPEKASDLEKKFQPVLDFDTDSCYHTSALDEHGGTNPGLGSVVKCPADDCRNPDRLDHANVYARSRCNNGWCAIMYEYYFEKDQAICGSFLGGHRHDWENVIVFTQGDEVKRVSPSCHGKYEHPSDKPWIFENTHPKMVYHKDGAGTHCIRHAKDGDDNVENHKKEWIKAALVGWEGYPSTEMRDKVLDGKNWSSDGGIRPKLADKDFANNLKSAAGDGVPGFDPEKDE